jgi:DNA polymerase-4
VLSGFSPQMEMASCDEAFLDVSPGAHVPVDPDRMADDVRRAVRDGVGLPCSVGAAPNKLLAKLASDMKKPDGITVIRPADVPGLMADLPVDRLCGIGRKTRDHLLRMGIRTCGELGAVPDQTLYARFGVWGQRLGRMGRGEDDAPVAYSDKDEDPKSVGHATTFPEDTRDPALVKSYLLMLCEKVGRRLRRRGLKGRVVSLTVRTADFAFQSRQAAAREATDGDVEIYRRAERIFDEMAPSMAMRLVGVTVSDLSRDDGQGFLLGDDDRRRRLAKTVDALNVKFGRMTVRHAAVDLARRKGVFRPSIPPTLSGAEDDESPG